MRVANDAFNSGLRQGMGIATYGKQLASMLSETGHSFFPVYGLKRVSRDQRIALAPFVQPLGVYGQSSPQDLRCWATRFLVGLPGHFLGFSHMARVLQDIDVIEQSSFATNLLANAALLSAFSLHGVARVNVIFSQRSTFLKRPMHADLWHLTCPLPVRARGIPTAVTSYDSIPIVLPTSRLVSSAHHARMVRAWLQMGWPVVTSNEGALPEAGGGAVHYLVPSRVESSVDVIERLGEDEVFGNELAHRGIVQTRQFSRKAHSERLQQGYEMASNGAL